MVRINFGRLLATFFGLIRDVPISFGRQPPEPPPSLTVERRRLELTERTPALSTSPLPVETPLTKTEVEESEGSACVPCSRDHVSTTAGVLSEALRFARSKGVTDADVLDRLDIAEQELNAMERIDATPAKLLKLPEKEKQLMEGILPKARELRHHIQEVTSVAELGEVAAEAQNLAGEFRLRALHARGIDLGRLKQIADQAEAGEITKDEAREQMKEFILESEKEVVG